MLTLSYKAFLKKSNYFCKRLFLVGKSIVLSAESAIAETSNSFLQEKVTVFGYGKIGSSISMHLLQRGAAVTVVEIDPIRAVLAQSHGFTVKTKSETLIDCRYIFSATGSKVLNKEDICSMQNGTFIFTATSADDELFINENDFDINYDGEHQIFITSENHRVILACGGRPINLAHGARIGIHQRVVNKFIPLVVSAMVKCINLLENADRNLINTLPIKDKNDVAITWLEIAKESILL
jgi:adenosylhomocysteinase